MRRRVGVAAMAVLVLTAGAPDAWADHGGLHLPITDLLPPLQEDAPAPDFSQVCGPDGLVCVRFVEARLAGWEAHFGCDHRAVFPTVYRLLTKHLRLQLEVDPAFFDDPAGLGFEALRFYDFYEQMLTAHLADQPVPPAWQVAMDAAVSGDHNVGQDMLLAISAHVQRDMPFVVAEVGLVTPDGRSRKPDHDRVNAVLSRAYDEIVPTMGDTYDPFMHTADLSPSPADDLTALQMVALWREGVWRNAERLVAAQGSSQYELVAESVELNAHLWAQGMAAAEVPGYRQYRDAYCADQRGAGGSSPSPDDPFAVAPVNPPAAVAGEPLPATGAGLPPGVLVMMLLGVMAGRHRRGPTI